MRERLISCEQGCQRGPEWAVWSFCQRVSNFHRPHCGPLSCSWPDLNGPFDGPPEAFHRAPCHRARGPGGFTMHNTWQVCKTTCPRQNKSHSVKRLLEINFLSPHLFCIHKTQDGKEQDDVGQHSDMGSHRRCDRLLRKPRWQNMPHFRLISHRANSGSDHFSDIVCVFHSLFKKDVCLVIIKCMQDNANLV